MVLDKIKGKIAEYKETSAKKKELKDEKKAVDEMLKEKAKIKAEEIYQQRLAEQRNKYIEEKEQKYVDEEIEKRGGTSIYSDTRTAGEKFKDGFSKVSENMGVVGGRVLSDTSETVKTSGLNSPNIGNFGRPAEEVLGRSSQPARYSVKLPKMAKSEKDLPYTEQDNMFFRSGPLFDNSSQLGSNLSEVSMKMKTTLPGGNSLTGGISQPNNDFMSKFRLNTGDKPFGSALGLNLGTSDDRSFSEKFLSGKKSSDEKERLRRFL